MHNDLVTILYMVLQRLIGLNCRTVSENGTLGIRHTKA